MSYYGLPLLKRPHWKWHVPLYFFLSGLAGASYLIATVGEWLGSGADRPIVAAGRRLALGGVVAGVPLLVEDLGRPARFHHMLRIVKPRSPMSAGSWALAFFGAFAAGSALLQELAAPPWLRRAVGLCGLPFATFVASYTGVLLAATAVPLWAKARLFLPPLFLLSGTSTAVAMIGLLSRRSRRLRGLELVALTGELCAVAGLVGAVGRRAGRPLLAGRQAGPFWLGAVGLGQVVPLLLHAGRARGHGRSGVPEGLAAGLVIVGGLLMRWTLVEAGKASSDDPEAALAYHG
ncbi:MAG TPA: NrfD/PsrC family molybdoenzyme membrane anchor subunit [Chloroflexota bacterium]|nr:NrfD/PsrC family molybdoenzyme membrane anchor subunit [Chloroflexota bacterium]